MTELIEQFFSSIFGNNVILATILISIVPIIELKGAIPFSMSYNIWGDFALSNWQAFSFALLGSSLIVPLLALVYAPIIKALKKTKFFKKIAIKIEEKINNKKNKIEEKANKKNENLTENNSESLDDVGQADLKKEIKKNKYDKIFFSKLFAVFTFVMLPLPLTGVWTGTCLAVVLGLGFWWSCLAVISGNIVAGLIVTVFSTILNFDPINLFYIFIAIVFVTIFVSWLIKLIKNKKKQKNNIE